eukprot:TRINITY_DN5355_c0_g1_i2.p1 TRINITY_DN5355_c0_g1~~TRINITY_DN5355_c0_g1_i2.p1  ORF type:complete len:220 (-),score=14.17 TRINITY_DN5355_c0_g1_i2:18-677(-)
MDGHGRTNTLQNVKDSIDYRKGRDVRENGREAAITRENGGNADGGRRRNGIRDIWDRLAESSNCCSKGKLACCRRCRAARTSILRSTFDRRTCMASCATSPSIGTCSAVRTPTDAASQSLDAARVSPTLHSLHWPTPGTTPASTTFLILKQKQEGTEQERKRNLCCYRDRPEQKKKPTKETARGLRIQQKSESQAEPFLRRRMNLMDGMRVKRMEGQCI